MLDVLGLLFVCGCIIALGTAIAWGGTPFLIGLHVASVFWNLMFYVLRDVWWNQKADPPSDSNPR